MFLICLIVEEIKSVSLSFTHNRNLFFGFKDRNSFSRINGKMIRTGIDVNKISMRLKPLIWRSRPRKSNEIKENNNVRMTSSHVKKKVIVRALVYGKS